MAAQAKETANKASPVKKKAPARKKAVSKNKATVTKKPAAKKKPVTREKTVAKKVAAAEKATTKAKDVKDYSKSAWEKRPARGVEERKIEQPLMTTLRAEHRHIAGVMKLFSEQLAAIESGQMVDTHVVYEIMDYMVSWPDRFHHPREDMIYGRAAEVDGSVADNVDTLQREHDQMATKGRGVLKDIEGWREGVGSGATVVASGKGYVERMYAHMNNEEELVFPQIESVLTFEDWRDLSEDDQLRPISDPVFGPRVQREFRNLARKLRRNVRRGVEHGALVEWVGIEALMESLEVLSMARDSARTITADHLRGAWEDSKDLFRESPVTAPFLCAANNARQTARWAGEVLEISRDTFDDLSRVNQERRDRVRLLDG